MKKTLLSGLILGILSLGAISPVSVEVWKKKEVPHSSTEYDIHLTVPGKIDQEDETYEKELLQFISQKAIDKGYDYFTFTVDATSQDVLVVHVQNFAKKPQKSESETLAVQYFEAKEILSAD